MLKYKMRNNHLLAKLWRTFFLVIAETIILLGTLRILKPLYIEYFRRDIDLTITSTGASNVESKASNVRVSSISVNRGSIDLSELELDNDWHYSDKGDFIYCYEEGPRSLNISLKNVGSIGISLVSEVGSGIVSVDIDGENWVEADLYANRDWGYMSFSKDLSAFVTPEKHLGLIIGVFILCLIGQLVWECLLRHKISNDRYEFSCEIIYSLASATILLVSSYLIQYKSINSVFELIRNNPEAVYGGLLLLVLLYLFLRSIIRNRCLVYIVLAMLVVIISIVNEVKETYRGVPLLPWDFARIREGMSIVRGYGITLDSFTVIAICLVILFGCFLYLTRIKRFKPKSLIRWSFIVAATVVLMFYVTTTFINGRGKGVNTFSLSDYYAENGLITSMMDYMEGVFPPKEPSDYSKNRINSIVENISGGRTESKTPNVIVIMSESFWDITRMSTVIFDEDPLPVLHQLQKECIHGNALSHVFGGATEVSEYEFLTGFSGEFFTESYMVYGSDLRNGFESAVSIFEREGYTTTAIHPFIATNYNRNAAYQMLGFDEFITEEDFDNKSPRIRNYISDQAMFDRILYEFDQTNKTSDKAQFIFAVSMQNHGGYWPESIYEKGKVSFKTDKHSLLTKGCMDDYVAGLHETDRALGEFLNSVKDTPEETIVIFFGDHMSDAGPKTEKMLDYENWKESDKYTQDFEEHIVPIFIWNNKQNSNKDIGLIGINQILPIAAQENHMDIPQMWRFLLDLHNYYSASDKMIVVDKDGVVRPLENMNEGQRSFRNQFYLLQYDYIWGKRYAGDLWETN